VDATKSEGREIIACRNAEIIVPAELDLSALKYIYCRSQAEWESLKYLMPPTSYARYQSRMFSSAKQNLYTRHHTFLETVRLASDVVLLNFSPDTMSPGPFQLSFEFKTLAGEHLQKRVIRDFMVRSPDGQYDFRIPAPAKEYEITVMLDDALIYTNAYRELATLV
jgi:hypothetical protein